MAELFNQIFSPIIKFFADWFSKMYETFIEKNYYNIMLEGLKNTLIITLGAVCIGVAIGIIIAVIKYIGEDSKALKPFVKICNLYVTIIRGIPVVVLLLIFFFVILVSADGITVAIITFGINSGAYMAELIRSGINSIDQGQMEAGRSLGMTRFQATYKIIIPQAIKYVLPTIGNEFIALLKETSVAGYVAVTDLTRAGNLVRNNTYDAINTLAVVAITYLIMVIGLESIIKSIERKLTKGDRRK